MIPEHLLYIHGLNATGQGVKATLLRGLFPQILTPDFTGSLEERMAALEELIGEQGGWTITGSSFGGLMAALFTCKHPDQVERLVLLAPALIWPDFAANPPPPVDTPGAIYHGVRDEIVPLIPIRKLAQRVFPNLVFHEVDDDHGLYATVHKIDWSALLERP